MTWLRIGLLAYPSMISLPTSTPMQRCRGQWLSVTIDSRAYGITVAATATDSHGASLESFSRVIISHISVGSSALYQCCYITENDNQQQGRQEITDFDLCQIQELDADPEYQYPSDASEIIEIHGFGKKMQLSCK
jgi:hypothetical protein